LDQANHTDSNKLKYGSTGGISALFSIPIPMINDYNRSLRKGPNRTFSSSIAI
jgi:hypothetical protein